MGRFYDGFRWRFIVTGRLSATITSLERLAMNRTVTYRLNQPAEHRGQVPSDDPRVNLLRSEPGVDTPYVSFNNRLVYGFRNELTPTRWVCRFAGILMQLEDAAQADQPYTNYTAYDPWQYLFKRKVTNAAGALVGPEGISWTATRGDVIVTQLLENTIYVDGDAYIELGTFQHTLAIDFNIQQGTSVGDALRQLVATGTLDIEFAPVYDPDTKPGICSTVKVYSQKGAVRSNAVFSWDGGRTVSGISNLTDGDQMANDVQFYNGQGGDPVTPQEDAPSQSRFGIWSAQQFFPGQTVATAVESMAELQLDLRKQGRRSTTITPTTLIGPVPLRDYTLGDRVPVFATNRLRQPIPWSSDATVYQRIYGIPITLSDDGVERVERLVASPDGFA